MSTIHSFRDDYSFLSNFYPCTIYLFGIKFNSVEAAYVAAKVPEHMPWIREKVARLSASNAKKFGRGEYFFEDENPENQKINIRSDWSDEMRIGVMRILLYQKFHPIFNPNLAGLIMDTKTAELIERNTWGDEFFGVYQGKGENHLGRLLTQRRTELFLEKERYLSFVFLSENFLQTALSGSFQFSEVREFYGKYERGEVNKKLFLKF
ncbi:NADAR family protein [Candidatus Nomurabacteria bacterium]|nr:NADAR family protein [Candidatus Nomurabacteria bacterium]